MAASMPELDIEHLTVTERFDLIGVLWDSIPEPLLPIPDWHREELQRRLSEATAKPPSTIPWEEVEARLREPE